MRTIVSNRSFLMAIPLLALFLCLCPPQGIAAEIDPDLLAGLQARSIGPAAMSGRVAAVEALDSNPDVLYVGAATGGLWKSVDGGVTWKPIFDDQPVAAIGAIAVHPQQSEMVWVGTGEGNPRNSASVGNGIYLSRDGGTTWKHVGLKDSERIHRIVLHPREPETAWVAALGKTWGNHPQRGIFKTTDGGETWKKVLYASEVGAAETTGGSDLVIDPSNPHKLFATLWQHRRWPWSFESGGPGSGIFVSHDSGETWKKLTPEDGLPKGNLGRIGIAVAPSNSNIVYALVEAEGDNVFLRSQDGGKSWETRAKGSEEQIGNRPFYYSDIVVDPEDPNRVYSLWSLISLTEDGGAHWKILVPFAEVHPDHHALWIDPANPHFLVNGNDGGLYISRDRGQKWTFVRNLPFAQFYHVRVDDETPFNVYGGLQDNGSWKGPSAVWENGGIRDYHWQEVLFGDGFDTVPDPRDPTQGYAMSQEGYLARWNVTTGEQKSVRPAPSREVPIDQDGLRFNWNAAVVLDPFEPDTVYFGSQYVHRSRDRGETWETLTEDLTTNKAEWQKQLESGGLTPDVTGAENFTSIVALAASPIQKGVLWAGTDDGRIHVTQDGGATWKSVEGNLKGVPAHTWVPHIEPSRHDAGEAFVVFDDHRRANWTPYVARTQNFGKSWKSLATDELQGYALAIVQDPMDRDLLFLGTEFGLWISTNGGDRWMKFTHGVPTVSVMDLAFQEKADSLVLGTHGRGIFILDDIAPLRGLGDGALEKDLHLFPSPLAQQYRVRQSGASRFPGHGEFRGENLPYGARILFSLQGDDLPHADDKRERQRQADLRSQEAEEKKAASKELETGNEKEDEEKEEAKKAKIRISDADGKVLRTFEVEVKRGINRAVWSLTGDPFKNPPRAEGNEDDDEGGEGPEVPPGTYTATVTYGEASATTEIIVRADPRFEISPEDRQTRWAAQLQAGRLQEVTAEAVERLHQTRQDTETTRERLEARIKERKRRAGNNEQEHPEQPVIDAAKALEKKITELEKLLWNPPKTKGYVGETAVMNRINVAQWFLGSDWAAPTAAQQTYLDRSEALLAQVLEKLNSFYSEDVVAFRKLVEGTEVRLLRDFPPLTIPTNGG